LTVFIRPGSMPISLLGRIYVRTFALLVAVLLISCTFFLAVCSAQAGQMIASDTNSSLSADKNTTPDAKAEPATPSANAAIDQPAPVSTKEGWRTTAGRVGVAVKMSLLGPGVEVATPLTYRTNIRVGFNAFSYSHNFTNDGTNYDASLRFRSVETHFDWFPFAGSFHVSPGLMIYNGNQISANASVTGGQTFSLGNVSYESSAANPITGTGKIVFNKVGPSVLAGWGNLLPRKHKHISVPVEFGVIFQGSPQATLGFAGTACDTTGANCQNVINNTSFQNNVVAQQNKLNNNMSAFKVYPILSVGFGYKF